ncbi:hypothetical protein [Chryseobacterium gwangjuense]|uniref:hypothetical protein n=1 Tax=Chryseobacterium gwangjuense TaxID=1069980 RepID=UPI001E63DC5B|nr:hypothetical protein [Chryseobacterium gwangjuense]MCE3074763.1 hypothetical protein [Chryseobacterium gwangjuense]
MYRKLVSIHISQSFMVIFKYRTISSPKNIILNDMIAAIPNEFRQFGCFSKGKMYRELYADRNGVLDTKFFQNFTRTDGRKKLKTMINCFLSFKTDSIQGKTISSPKNIIF